VRLRLHPWRLLNNDVVVVIPTPTLTSWHVNSFDCADLL
jgi:hypothetical protein